jgi:alpha-maltose-1-phosphate synthase
MKPLRIAVLGTRGVPGVQGGIEKHCQELYPRLAVLGVEVSVFGRKGYVPSQPYVFKGVQVIPIWTPRRKHSEAIIHTIWGLLHLALASPPPDLIHIHGIGPGILTPLARLLGFKVVLTHHGPDYEREKWGMAAKLVLRQGEKWAVKWAHGTISVSETIRQQLLGKYGRASIYIPNGVTIPEMGASVDLLTRLDLKPRGYILTVGRFVPEKGFHDLLEAFSGVPGEVRLVIAGDADHDDSYSRNLKLRAAQDRRVVLTGFIKGRDLAEIYSNARFFVLPSYHEGLPLVLLEALSYGLPALISAIPANLEVIKDSVYSFAPGDVSNLRQKLCSLIAEPWDPDWPEHARSLLKEKYDWDKIAEDTLRTYYRVISPAIPKAVRIP